MRNRWRLVLLVVASIAVLGAGGFFAFRRLAHLDTVPGTEGVRVFALLGNRAYAIVQLRENELDYEVRQIDLGTGEYLRLAGGAGDPASIATDGRTLVWSVCDTLGKMPCDGRVLAMPLPGGASRVLSDVVATRIAIGNRRAYLASRGALLAADLEKPQPANPVSGHTDVQDVAADESYVYELTSQTLQRIAHDGHSMDGLATSLPNATHMTLGRDGVYVACEGSSAFDDSELRYVPFAGSPPVVLASGLRHLERPVPWGSSLAFVHAVPHAPGSSGATLTLSVVPIAGGDRRMLRDRFIGDLVGDGSRLYAVMHDRVIRLPHE